MPTESTFLLFGLLRAAAAAGWWYGRYLDRKVHGPEEDEPPLSQGYLRGLNLLLDQKTDKALEMFVRMIATDDEALDTHFALGSLFRRRGEVERAIRIHQNLLARPDLSASHRHAALFALGEDYLRAGLLDRAESLFRQVAEVADDAEPALRNLVGILENLGEWNDAIEVRRQIERVTGESQATEIVHYHCELAEQALAAGEARVARTLLKKAQRVRRAVPRGAMVRARLAEQEDDLAMAWRLLRNVVREDIALLPEVLPDLHRLARRREDMGSLERLLRDLRGEHPSHVDAIAYAAIVCRLMEPPVLEESVVAFITGNDTLASLVNAAELQAATPEARSEPLTRMTGGLRRLAMSVPRYRCESCGFSAQSMNWQCPSCKTWDSARPTSELPLEALLRPRRRD